MGRALLALLVAQLTEIRRSRTALFWSLAFPLGFLFLFGGLMARGDARVATLMMPGLLTTMLLSGSLFGVALPLVVQRESGVLRRYRVTPLSAITLVLAQAATALLMNAATFTLLLVVGHASFHTRIAGSLPALALAFLAAAAALLPIGLLVGSAARDMRTAPAIANLLFFPLMFLSGSAIPFFLLPDGVRTIARVLPTSYVNEALTGVIVRGEAVSGMLSTLAALLAMGAIGVMLDALLFRWEGTEPIPRRSLLAIAGGFALAVGGAALLVPAFRMAEVPGGRRVEAGSAKGQLRVLRGATLLDGLGGRIERARVVIRDHRVAEIGFDDERTPVPAGAQVDDLGGRFLIPGLFDSHVHLGGSAGVGTTPIEQSETRYLHDLQAYLASGVTSVVSLTDDLDSLRGLRAEVAAARMRAPRVFLSGPSITAPGGHPAEMFGFLPGLAETLTRQVATPEAARAAIAELAAKDVDIVKLVLEAGSPERPLPRLSEAVFRTAVEEAKKAHLRTTVHVGTDDDARLAVEAGADGIEHAPRGISDQTIALMAARRVTLTPTLAVYDFDWKRATLEGRDQAVRRLVLPEVMAGLREPGWFFERMGREAAARDGIARSFDNALTVVRRAVRAGLPILAGSDAGNPATYHGPALVHELELLARAGAPLGDVLVGATSRAADRLGQKELGRISKGAVADLVVLGADPTEDAAAYRDVRGVYLGGRRLDLDHLLDTPAGSWRPGH